MKFVVGDKKDEIVQLKLVEYEWGVAISRVKGGNILLELYNSHKLLVRDEGAEVFRCEAGVVE